VRRYAFGRTVLSEVGCVQPCAYRAGYVQRDIVRPETVAIAILGAIMVRELVLDIVARRVEEGILAAASGSCPPCSPRQAKPSDPAVRAAAKKAGKTFAAALGIQGAAKLAISRL
jgi:hypothetical protein